MVEVETGNAPFEQAFKQLQEEVKGLNEESPNTGSDSGEIHDIPPVDAAESEKSVGHLSPVPSLDISVLLQLPAELLVKVFSHLDYRSLTKSRATCSQLRNPLYLPPRKVFKAILMAYELGSPKSNFYGRSKHHDSKIPGKWDDRAVDFAFFPCYTCLGILPRSAFTSAQTQDLRTIGAAHADLRFCFNCGLSVVWKVPGRLPLKLPDGRWYVCCKVCGETAIETQRQTAHWIWWRMCKGCWDETSDPGAPALGTSEARAADSGPVQDEPR